MFKVSIIMPAYNASKTLEQTYKRLPSLYDEVVVCDDASRDDTVRVSKKLGFKTIIHKKNLGYGANQKSLYDFVLKNGADAIIMVHPDNQYDTSCLPKMINEIKNGSDLVLGSRTKTARLNGMPMWRYIPNRTLTYLQNKIYKARLSEYHTGLRAYSSKLLKAMPYESFSDDFVFDSEVIAWSIANKYKITEVDTNCYYNSKVSSISFLPSLSYGCSSLRVLWKFQRGYYTSQK